jgi:phi LC3 family holin
VDKLNIDWKARLKHKAFWLSLISLSVLLLQQLGLPQIADYIPKNYADIINTIFAILALLGIVVDTSTQGINDNK